MEHFSCGLVFVSCSLVDGFYQQRKNLIHEFAPTGNTKGHEVPFTCSRP